MNSEPSGLPPSAGSESRAPRSEGPRAASDKARGRAAQPGRPRGVVQPAGVDLLREAVVPFADVPKLGVIPGRRGGSRLNVRTVYRWATAGLRGVRLPSALVGGQRVTTVEALARFFAAVAAAADAGPGASPRPADRRHTSGPDVEAELDRAGL